MQKKTLALSAALIVTLFLFAIFEISIRLISKTNPETGALLIGRFAYLPYRPGAQATAAAWDAPEASSYLVRDDDLGWSIKPNGGTGEYTSTADGLRGPKGSSVSASVPEGRIRISIYGDSFTHGDEVGLKDTWGDQLQHLRGNLEVLNFGVPAYGTDQALLRFRRDGRKFRAQFHILGIWTEDLIRNLNVIRFYLNPQGPLGNSKPRFVLNSSELEEINSPVMPRQAFLDTVLQRNVSPAEKYDYWYRDDEQRFPFYYHLRSVRAVISVYNAYHRREIRNQLYFEPEGEALRVTVAIAEAFHREVEALGSRAYVSVIPMRDFLEAHGSGHFPLVEMLKARSIPVLDFGPAFASKAKETGAEALYLPSGHLTPLGNRLLAEEMNRALAGEFESAQK